MAEDIERAMVTGVSGFLGSALALRLSAEGTPVAGLSRRGGGHDNVAADVRSLTEVRQAFTVVRPSHVFHVAGDRPSQVTSVAGYRASLELNALGTVNVIVAAAEVGCRMVVVAGSAEEYGDAPSPYREDGTERPTSAYGASKLAATRAALTASSLSGCPVAVARPTVCYGPRQPDDMLLSALLRALLDGRPFPMTTGEQTRDFVFVDDVAEGLVRLARSRSAGGGAWNLGSGRARRVREVAELAEELVGAHGLLQLGAVPPREGEPTQYAVDMSATRELLGWEPEVDLEEGLTRTLAAMRR